MGATGLEWKNVVLMGFGKGAGLALYASLLKIIPRHVGGMIFFSPVVPFPSFMAEKMAVLRKGAPASPPVKMFTVWGTATERHLALTDNCSLRPSGRQRTSNARQTRFQTA